MSLLALLSSAVILSLPISPNPKLTPGAVFPGVSVETITMKGYANVLHGGVRHVPESEKCEVFDEYFGSVPAKPGSFEVDHLISLELGGSNEITNLWPESYLTSPYNAHTKDRLEDWMAARVRTLLASKGHDAATVLLVQYQHEIATDWIAAFHKYISPTP